MPHDAEIPAGRWTPLQLPRTGGHVLIGGVESGIQTAHRRVFVVMPFGKKEVLRTPRADVAADSLQTDEALKVDFDDVYQFLFKPSLRAAGLQPFRADDEEAAGDILKDMFAELVTADFVLADISILNANVFYELGIRHTVGPRGVICLRSGNRGRHTSPLRASA